jgi:hypothetical protein
MAQVVGKDSPHSSYMVPSVPHSCIRNDLHTRKVTGLLLMYNGYAPIIRRERKGGSVKKINKKINK